MLVFGDFLEQSGAFEAGSGKDVVGELLYALEGALTGTERIELEVYRLAVVAASEGVTEDDGQEAFFEDVVDGVEVVEALGHLAAVYEEVGAVDPVLEELDGVAAGAFALGDLVLVVGECEVDAAGVDVEVVLEVLHAHGRALEVPAGAALAPWALPEDVAVAGFAAFPEDEVCHGVALVFVAIDG